MDLTQLTMFKQIDVERLFAANLFISPQLTLEQCGWLDPKSLVHESIRMFWQSAKDNIISTMSDMQAQEAITRIAMEVGLLTEVMGWSGNIYTSTVPQAYAQEIARRNYIVSITPLANQLAAALTHGDDREARQVIETLHDKHHAMGVHIDNAMDIAEQFDVIMEAGNRSIDTFIPPLDAATAGLERQTLTIIAARTSMGKTSLAFQIARNVAASGQKVIYFTLEDSKLSLWARAACPLIGMTWKDVRAGKVTPARKHDLKSESYSLAAQYAENLNIDDTPQSTESIWRVVAEQKPAVVIVDHIRNLRDKNDSEIKRLGLITENLKNIAKSFDCAMIGLAQLNRRLESQSDKRPTLADLRDSGEIEENADLVLMIYRDSYYTGTLQGQLSPTELWIRKFRNGQSNVLINLVFDPRREWFDSPPDRR